MPDKEPPHYSTTRAFPDCSAPPPRFPIENTNFSDHALLAVCAANSVLVSQLRGFAPCFNPVLGELDVSKELDRQKSFGDNWTSAYDVRAAAKVGFFYLGSDDRIQCFSCGCVLQNWDFPHHPVLLHMRLQPPCAMALGVETRNIPVTSGESSLLRILAPYHLTENHLTTGCSARSNDWTEVPTRLFGTVSPSMNNTTSIMRYLQDRMQAIKNRDFTRTSSHSVAETGSFELGPIFQQKGQEDAHNSHSFLPDANRLNLNIPRQELPSTSAARLEPLNHSAAVINRDGNGELSADARQVLVEAAMRTEVAIFAIDLKFEKSLVRDVIRQKIEENGIFDLSAVAFIEAVQETQRLCDEPELKLERHQEIQRRKIFCVKFPESLPEGDVGYGTSEGTLEVSGELSPEGASPSSVDDPPHLQTSGLNDTALEATSSTHETAASTRQDSVPALLEDEE